MKTQIKILFLLSCFFTALALSKTASAFCGFYVAKADTDLFNNASKVVLARSQDRTVMTMANDYQGDVDDFAIVIPVPTVITKDQVNVAENKLIDHLDAYTAPRLVEYHDHNPCAMRELRMEMARSAMTDNISRGNRLEEAKSLGVTIEEEYSVGEYDIIILSADQSDGLLRFLNMEGYRIPDKAQSVLGSYIKQDMKFFLAKVNLQEFESEG